MVKWEEIITYLKNRYEANEIFPSDFDYCEQTSPQHPYPLTIKVTKGLLDRAKRRKRLIIDAINGVIRQNLRVGAKRNVEIGFFNIHVEDGVPKLTNLYAKVVKWEGRLNNDFVQQELASEPEWRKILVYLRCYEELEEIDIDKFISNYGNE